MSWTPTDEQRGAVEQARAEAERMAEHVWAAWTGAEGELLRGATIQGFLAGHEAATRTRVVTTVTELDALPVGSVVLDVDEEAWQKPDALDTWVSGQQTLALTSAQLAADGPFRVLYVPEEDA